MDVALILNGPKLRVDVIEDYIICADGGYDALPEGLTPTMILGDMDSISDLPNGVKTIIIPKEKDYSDGEYAVRLLSEMEEVENITIYAAFGGRFDHQLVNLGLLKIANSLGKRAKIVDENVMVTYETGKLTLKISKGDLISLISAEGEARIAKSTGLYYPLNNLSLSSLDSRGISNVAVSDKVEIKIEKGGIFLFVMKEHPKA